MTNSTISFALVLLLSNVTCFAPSRSRTTLPQLFLSIVPFNEGNHTVLRTYIPSESTEQVTENYTMCYKIARPMALSSRQAAPIVVLHGGPSVPSDYLFPLVDQISYRSIVFYDQIGCGRSDEPKDVKAYSIDRALDDLESLLKKLGVQRRGFHLYGQSFGGILAFEYLKRVAERNDDTKDEGCLSVVLSSVPTSVLQVEAEADILVNGIVEENPNGTDIAEVFRITYQCRTPKIPEALSDAYARAGTVWRGTKAIKDYVAKPPSEKASCMPSALVMRGEHDFVTEACVQEWSKSLFNHNFVRQTVLEGCAHHGLLERGEMYGEVLERFFAQYD